MSVYSDYLDEIETRRQQGLNPKPIEDAALIKGNNIPHRR